MNTKPLLNVEISEILLFEIYTYFEIEIFQISFDDAVCGAQAHLTIKSQFNNKNWILSK